MPRALVGVSPHKARSICKDETEHGQAARRGGNDVMTRTRLLGHSAVIAALLAGLMAALGAAPVAAAEARDPILREDLALIEKQLARIEQVIDRLAARQQHLSLPAQAGAGQAAMPEQRVLLDVWQLRADINEIEAGIRGYLSPPRLPPRKLAPLSGDYLDRRLPAQAGSGMRP